MERCIIVGAGAAGTAAAFALRDAGFGGEILLLGAEPYAPYHRPPLSKEVLGGGMPAPPPLRDAAAFDAAGIAFWPGCMVIDIDSTAGAIETAGGDRYAYDRLLLATGGQARALTMPGGEHAVTLRGFDDAVKLRAAFSTVRRLLVIGAGVIGLEIAAAARTAGLEVVVLEAADRAMARFCPVAAADTVVAAHRSRGVTFEFDVGLDRLERHASGVSAYGADGRVFAAEIVVAAIGLQPTCDLAVRAGLAVDNGIVVDEFGRSTVAGIFAAGDGVNFWHPGLARRLRLESWRHAMEQGAAVGRAMAGQGEPYLPIPWAWSDQYDINLQVAGLPFDGTQMVMRGDAAAGRFTLFHLREGVMVGGVTLNQGRDMRPIQSLIKSGRPVDAAQLADANLPLKRLLA